MSTPIWILITLSAAIGSAVLAYFLARRGAPTKQQIEALNTELEAARSEAQQVEGKVTEHFERSAMLFGQLAKDYKAFLDHYSVSAQALGLSERRARELLEQGYQPLLTHLEADPAAEPGAEAGPQPAAPGGRAPRRIRARWRGKSGRPPDKTHIYCTGQFRRNKRQFPSESFIPYRAACRGRKYDLDRGRFSHGA